MPYRGGAPALNDLLGGNVDMLFDNLPGSLPSVRSGAIRPVAVTAKTRLAELPDVPAMAELLPGYELTSWTALIGPANMPPDLVAQINALTGKALRDPWVQTALRRPRRHHLADHAAGDLGLSRQRGSAAAADHEGGRDQAGRRRVDARARMLTKLGSANWLQVAGANDWLIARRREAISRDTK